MNDFSTSALLAAAQNLMDRLTAYGYDQVKFMHINLEFEDPPACWLTITDEFQKSASWDERVQVGLQSFTLDGAGSAFVIPEHFKMREMRELHYLAKRLGQSKELASQFVSAAGREFAAKMEAELTSLRGLITHAK